MYALSCRQHRTLTKKLEVVFHGKFISVSLRPSCRGGAARRGAVREAGWHSCVCVIAVIVGDAGALGEG